MKLIHVSKRGHWKNIAKQKLVSSNLECRGYKQSANLNGYQAYQLVEYKNWMWSSDGIDLGNIGSDDGLKPDGPRPTLLEPALTYHQWGSVTFFS